MIRISDVKKDYVDGETLVHALRGVSLDIDPAEFISIAGPSGSGKTTLLNLIGCIDSLDSGDIVIDGETLRVLATSVHELKTGRGYIHE